MKLSIKVLSAFLAVLCMMGSLVSVSVVEASAAEEEPIIWDEDTIKNVYIKENDFATPEDRLDPSKGNMKLMMESDGFQLYVDEISGEVATKNMTTGEILFSNPYDLTGSKGSVSTKSKLLSQLIVYYVDNGTSGYLTSFTDAAMRNQIKAMNIKNGVRVEYTIGIEDSRKLVPRWISEKSFERYIYTPLTEAKNNGDLSEYMYNRFLAFYPKQTNFLTLEGKNPKIAEELLNLYPVLAKMNIWVIESDLSSVQINELESIIKGYCPDYTFEQMDADHEETGYEAEDEQFPVFKMALEYFLDEKGMSVRLPCNGLRYDMSTYTLENISILPYMGAGHSDNPGYNFFPDGAGALFDYEQLDINATTAVGGMVYGTDFAYHNISQTNAYQQAIRYPVYGSVASETIYHYTYTDKENNTLEASVSATMKTEEEIRAEIAKAGATLVTLTTETYDRGFLAIIESGESLAKIETYHGGSVHDYNHVQNYFNPKPKDSYDIADSISVTSSSSWTVVSNRKYTGSLRIRYVFLTDEEKAAEAKINDPAFTYYETTWLGMAEAYRDYLIEKGTLQKLTENDVEADIPLYLEVFGAMETQQTIMTIPVMVMTPLTTFDNVYSIYEDLYDNGIKNINFRLTGFANGGMYSTIPSSLKWEKAVGGAKGFRELLEKFAAVNESGDANVQLYPDFDFAYTQMNTLFDSFILNRDAVKTIDNRYTSLRQYSATLQGYISFHQLAVSPSRYSHFYEKLLKNYSKYDITNMSVSTLGTALNSDFDEDDPYNREDNKEYTIDAFADLKKAGYNLMTDGGNAYSWAYVDHILNVSLDSSRFVKSAASVPFIGAVLHGYVQFAGTPLNEESNTAHALLKAIENGAGMYFVLSYQNTNELKEDFQLSQNYSIRYDIWSSDMMEYYKELNGLMKDLQTKVIIDHDFWTGTRVQDADELEQDIADRLAAAVKEEADKQANIDNDRIVNVADAWYNATNADAILQAQIDEMKIIAGSILSSYSLLSSTADTLEDTINETIAYIYEVEQKLLEESANLSEDDDPINTDPFEDEAVKKKISKLTAAVATMGVLATDILLADAKLELLNANILEDCNIVTSAKEIIQNAENLSPEVKEMLTSKLEGYGTGMEKYKNQAKQYLELFKEYTAESLADGTANPAYAAKIALDALEAVYDLEGDNDPYAAKLYNFCATQIFDMDSILKGVENGLKGDSDDEETEDDVDKYFVDNKQIVVVTYGDRDPNTFEKVAAKAFILNYNNFTVRVDYAGSTYTIPAYGYVVLEPDMIKGEG